MEGKIKIELAIKKLCSFGELSSKQENIELSNGGVYFWVYNKQIIYVGTANHYNKRLSKHLDLFKKGGRTIRLCENYYDSMQNTFAESENNKNIWIPSNKENKNKTYYLKYKGRGKVGDSFDNWIDEKKLNDFLLEVKIYCIPIQNHLLKSLSTLIETYIQVVLYRHFKLSDYIKRGDTNNNSSTYGALGKQEHPYQAVIDIFSSISFTFSTEIDIKEEFIDEIVELLENNQLKST